MLRPPITAPITRVVRLVLAGEEGMGGVEVLVTASERGGDLEIMSA